MKITVDRDENHFGRLVSLKMYLRNGNVQLEVQWEEALNLLVSSSRFVGESLRLSFRDGVYEHKSSNFNILITPEDEAEREVMRGVVLYLGRCGEIFRFLITSIDAGGELICSFSEEE